MNKIEIVDYTPAYAQAFKELNEAWINKFFELEEDDLQTLNHPEKVIQDGGFIFVALVDDEPLGVCALRKKTLDTYEFSKMAVAETYQRLGIGRRLGETAIAKAKEIKAKRVYLEGNTLLQSAVHLYKKLGFIEIQSGPSHYKRVNIMMELMI